MAWIADNALGRSLTAIWRREVARHAGFLLVAQYAGLALGILNAALAARMLGPTRYGLAAIVIAYPTLVRGLLTVRSDLVSTRYISAFKGAGRYAEILGVCKLGYGLDLVISVATLVVVWLTAQVWAAEVLHVEHLTWLTVAFAASFPFHTMRKTSLSILASWKQFGWIAGFQFAERVLTLVLVVGLIKTGFGVAGMVVGTALAGAVIGLGTMIRASWVLGAEHVGRWWTAGSIRGIRHLWRELASFFGWNQLSTAVASAAGQVPVLLLGYFWGPASAGLFRLASTVVTAGGYLDDIFKDVVYPDLSTLWESGTRARLIPTLRRWTRTLGIASATLPAVLMPVLPFVVPILFKRSYLPAVLPAQLMLFGEAVSSLLFWVRPLYYGMGLLNFWAASLTVFQLALLAVLSGAAWQFGVTGVAAATAVGNIVFNVFMARYAIGAIGRMTSQRTPAEASVTS